MTQECNYQALLDELAATGSGAAIVPWVRECMRLQTERDEARRLYVRTWTCEHGSMMCDMLVCAARKWGRNAALALYPDAELRRLIARDNFGTGEGLDDDEEEELQNEIAENHRRLDKEFPEK